MVVSYHRLVICFFLLWTFLLMMSSAQSDETQGQNTTHDAHAHHAMEHNAVYKRSVHHYTIPDLLLLNENGKSVSLHNELASDQIVVLNFIFTSCTAICPVLSTTFSQLHNKLISGNMKFRMISISIDPEHDTPQQLKKYAAQFGASEHWKFLTGSRDDIIKVQRAFGAYLGDKMNHRPLTFIKGTDSSSWIRLQGFTGVDLLFGEYTDLQGS